VRAPLDVAARALRSRVAGAHLDRVRRPVAEADHYRPQPAGLALGLRRDGDRHRVEHPGIAQPLLELGHNGRIVDVTLLPGRESADPVRAGAALADHLHLAEADEIARREM